MTEVEKYKKIKNNLNFQTYISKKDCWPSLWKSTIKALSSNSNFVLARQSAIKQFGRHWPGANEGQRRTKQTKGGGGYIDRYLNKDTKSHMVTIVAIPIEHISATDASLKSKQD